MGKPKTTTKRKGSIRKKSIAPGLVIVFGIAGQGFGAASGMLHGIVKDAVLWVSLCFVFLGAVFAFYAYAPTIISHKIRWQLLVWGLDLLVCGTLFYNSILAPRNHPSLTFYVRSPGNPQDDFFLSDKVFTDTPWNGTSHSVGGFVLFPISTGQSNFVMNLGVSPSDFVEGMEVYVSLPAHWAAEMGKGWHEAEWAGATGYIISNGIPKPMRLLTWIWKTSEKLYAKDGAPLPTITIPVKNLLMSPNETNSPHIGSMGLMAKTKEIEIAHVEFRPAFLEVSNGLSHKPTILTPLASSGSNQVDFMISYPPRDTNQQGRQ